MRSLVDMSIKEFLKKVIFKIIPVVALSVILPALVSFYIPEFMITLIVVTIVSIGSTSVFVYLIGLDKGERSFIVSKIKQIITKFTGAKKK